MELVTFNKFKTQEEAAILIAKLKSANIKYQIENIAPSVDLTFTGGTGLEDKIAVKIKPEDFDKVDQIFEDEAFEEIELIEKDYYLYEFSDKELIEILENYDEWSKTDFLLAQKILKEKGQEYSNNEIRQFKDKKIEKLKQPEIGHKGWLIFGYITALLGGLLGVFIGYHHFRFKKRIPTGERVYAYDLQTRKTGLRILYIGIVAFIFWIVIWISDQI